MAIYSLNHSAVGKTTHAPGTGSAHVRYITRPNAKAEIVAHLVPDDRHQARRWMNDHEAASRKNARVCDKLIIALPIELSPAQRVELVREFAQDITKGGAVPYYAAIHAAGKDAQNPHVHFIIVDRDQVTGKRVLLTTEKGSTDHFRARWEIVCNQYLAKSGIDSRIDRRTLEAQGIEREPQIHIGAEGQHIEENVARPSSRTVEFKNAAGTRTRKVDYSKIDQGRTRKEFNDQIIDFNLEQARQSPNFAVRKRAELAQKVRAMAQSDKKRFSEARREITRRSRAERAETWSAHRACVKDIGERRTRALAVAKETVRQAFAPAWDELSRKKADDQRALQAIEADARLKTSVAKGAIAAMKRGADFVSGHLRALFQVATTLPQLRKGIVHAAKQREKALRTEEKRDTKHAVDAVKATARDAYKAERSRYTAQRQDQAEALRGAWKAFHDDQAQAQQAQKAYKDSQEREITRIAEAIGRAAKPNWERRADPQQGNAPAPASVARPQAGHSLGR